MHFFIIITFFIFLYSCYKYDVLKNEKTKKPKIYIGIAIFCEIGCLCTLTVSTEASFGYSIITFITCLICLHSLEYKDKKEKHEVAEKSKENVIKNNEYRTKTLNTRKLNILSNRKYDKNINDYYLKVIKYMKSSIYPERENIHNMNKMEEVFIKEFLYQVQFVRKKYFIDLIRYSQGELCVLYNRCPVGKISLKNENNIWMQIYIGLDRNKLLSDLTFEEALQNIRYWISYIKNHLKEQRF